MESTSSTHCQMSINRYVVCRLYVYALYHILHQSIPGSTQILDRYTLCQLQSDLGTGLRNHKVYTVLILHSVSMVTICVHMNVHVVHMLLRRTRNCSGMCLGRICKKPPF